MHLCLIWRHDDSDCTFTRQVLHRKTSERRRAEGIACQRDQGGCKLIRASVRTAVVPNGVWRLTIDHATCWALGRDVIIGGWALSSARSATYYFVVSSRRRQPIVVISLTSIAPPLFPERVGWNEHILKTESKIRDVSGSISSLNVCESRVQGTASRSQSLTNRRT